MILKAKIRRYNKNKENLGQNLTYLLKALNGWSAFKSAAE